MLSKGFLLLVMLFSTALAYPESDYTNYEYADAGEDNEEYFEEALEEGPLPDFVKATSQHLIFEEGDTAIIPCELTGATDYSLMIKKVNKKTAKEDVIFLDKQKVPSARRYNRFSIDNGNVMINNVRRSDAGQYVCRLESTEPMEIYHRLEVQYAPKLTQTSDSTQRVLKGESVRLECEAEGNPKPDIVWSMEEGKLPSGANNEEGLSMTLEKVDRHVAGTYICSAQNGIGKPATAALSVIVDYAPEIITEKEIVRTGDGDNVELVCIVHAHPVPKVTWRKDNQATTFEHKEHDRGHRHALIIPNVEEEDFGVYQCLANNDIGNASASVHLTGHPNRPEITSDTKGGEETSYTLTWVTESYYPIVEYRLSYRKAKANDSTDHPGDWQVSAFDVTEEDQESKNSRHTLTHTLNNLEPATDYHGALRVRNKYNWSANTEFTFSTKKVFFTDKIDQQPLSSAPATAGISCVLLLLLPALLLRT